MSTCTCLPYQDGGPCPSCRSSAEIAALRAELGAERAAHKATREALARLTAAARTVDSLLLSEADGGLTRGAVQGIYRAALELRGALAAVLGAGRGTK